MSTVTRLSYTHEQLKSAFELVQDKEHWKNPINSKCTEAEIPLIEEAIVYFTATVPTFKKIGKRVKDSATDRFKTGDVVYEVKADGYYMGPAGP